MAVFAEMVPLNEEAEKDTDWRRPTTVKRGGALRARSFSVISPPRSPLGQRVHIQQAISEENN